MKTEIIHANTQEGLIRYFELKSRGWVYLWGGEGAICLQEPKNQKPKQV